MFTLRDGLNTVPTEESKSNHEIFFAFFVDLRVFVVAF